MASYESAAAKDENNYVSDQQNRKQYPEPFKYSKRVTLKSIINREDGGEGLVGSRVVVGGWVKHHKDKFIRPKEAAAPVKDVSCHEVLITRIPLLRGLAKIFGRGPAEKQQIDGTDQKTVPRVTILNINDGSCAGDLQILVDSSMSLLVQVISSGSSILVEGVLQISLSKGRNILQLKAEKILHVGVVDLKNYPIANRRLSLDFLRAHPHLRPRTSAGASITRVRSALLHLSHTFCQNNGFIHVHMPVITTTDMSSYKKMFRVTTLFNRSDRKSESREKNIWESINLDTVKAALKEKSSRIEELKRSDSNKEALATALIDLQKANELARQLEGQQKVARTKVETLDFANDFFSRQAYLTVSAKLHLESYACALSSVYTIGPIFEAEYCKSSKHLAEMWMVEVELAFAELEDAMNSAEDFLKFLCKTILENCFDDMKLLSKRVDKHCIDRLKSMISNAFPRITYTEALQALSKVSDDTDQNQLTWGVDLQDEHTSYLVDEIYKSPVIIYDYPKEFKPFYARSTDDGRRASAFDIVVPKAGVLVTGSQKEERLDVISSRIQELGLRKEEFDWYLDLRQYGTVKHAGFSLFFDRMVMFATGLEDIRDAIPFPRTAGHADA